MYYPMSRTGVTCHVAWPTGSGYTLNVKILMVDPSAVTSTFTCTFTEVCTSSVLFVAAELIQLSVWKAGGETRETKLTAYIKLWEWTGRAVGFRADCGLTEWRSDRCVQQMTDCCNSLYTGEHQQLLCCLETWRFVCLLAAVEFMLFIQLCLILLLYSAFFLLFIL